MSLYNMLQYIAFLRKLIIITKALSLNGLPSLTCKNFGIITGG